MASALDRALATKKAADLAGVASKKTDRSSLIARLKQLPEDAVVAYVEANSLPATTKQWSEEQLLGLVTALEGGATTPAKPAAKTTTKTAPAKKVPLAYLIAYNKQLKIATVSRTTAETAPDDDGDLVFHRVVTEEDMGKLAGDVQLAVFNIGKETPAKKFANKAAAAEAAFNSLKTAAEASEPRPTPKKGAAKKAPSTPRAPRVIDLQPKAKEEIKQVRAGSKVATLIDLLARPEGTTLAEIETELSKTGKPIVARSWIGYDLNSVTGYGAKQEGDTIRLVLPKGMKAPLAHKEAAVAAPAPVAKKTAKKAVVEEVVEEENAQVEEVTEVPEPAPAKKATTKKVAPPAAKKTAKK